jgi:aldose 1-epimerase
MYRIEHQQDNNLGYLKLINTNNNSIAKISLSKGASLQELFINNTIIIKDMSPLPYSVTYASSILFPFANRIKNGHYVFNQKQYQLEINHKNENNAIHGLVYDKTFEILSKKVTDNSASVKLFYIELNESKGFPYTFNIELEYILTEESLALNVSVKNTDSKPFPFTIGWHPYFFSSDLTQCYLNFESDKKVVFGDRMITRAIEDYQENRNFEIINKQLDDCFILSKNTLQFITPEYKMEMKASSNDIFLQLYTVNGSFIAIEPTTGISDSFNNKIGLQVLEPNKAYKVNWNLALL